MKLPVPMPIRTATGATLTLLAALLLAAPARAAEVVAVRVGNHPTYTRVVFELDAPAGYGIEHRAAADGVSEILVSMDAGSPPRSLDPRTVMVDRIAVESQEDRSTARIRLRKNPSRVKRQILANPPRLVFDLVFPEPMLAAARRRAAKESAVAAAPGAKPAPKTVPTAPAGAMLLTIMSREGRIAPCARPTSAWARTLPISE